MIKQEELKLTTVDLGKIDLLVALGKYRSRFDFLKQAVQGQLETHDSLRLETPTPPPQPDRNWQDIVLKLN